MEDMSEKDEDMSQLYNGSKNSVTYTSRTLGIFETYTKETERELSANNTNMTVKKPDTLTRL